MRPAGGPDGLVIRELAVSARSPAAERVRAFRARRRQGIVIARVRFGPEAIADLIRLGWLNDAHRGDNDALTQALGDLIKQATTMRVTKSAGSEGVCYAPLRATDGTIATEIGINAQLSSSLGPPGEHAGTRGLDLQNGATEIVEDNPPGAKPSAALIEPYEIDPIELWVPRLDLFTQARIWAPEWGPRPGQVDCAAPEQLLEDFGIWPSGLA
jgi:hypothetical protein